MKRIALVAVAVVVGVFTSAASASPGASSDAHRAAATKTTWTAEYNASVFYGGVKCNGKTTVNSKYPGGKEVETCTSTEGTLKNMTAGKGQKVFHGEGGAEFAEWESDHVPGMRTTNYTYRVNKALTSFKLIAIYAPPEV